MENILVGLIALTMINGESGEGTNKIVTNTIGNEITIGEMVEINTGRVSSTGEIGTCWASPVYGSNGVKEVKIRCN